MYDVVIIGAGVVGCAVARELSRRELKILLLDQAEDIGEGTSKANSAIVHAGYDAMPGSLKARFNVKGSQLMPALCRELDVPYRQNGSLVLAFDETGREKLTELHARGCANGVEGLEIITGEEVLVLEPALSGEICAALVAPTGGIVCPFELTQALAENACANGVELRLSSRVEAVERKADGFCLHTNQGNISSRTLVNCAGLFADIIHNQLTGEAVQIIPRRGEYMLLDKACGTLITHTVFQAPGPLGKGVLVTPTVHGNLLVGPTAEGISNRADTATTAQGMALVEETAQRSMPNLPLRQVITSFSGLRAHLAGADSDFQIGSPQPGYFEALGIESPGLSAAPAIGVHLAGEIARHLHARERDNFLSTRKIVRPREMSLEQRAALIKEQPLYGRIVCRCEQVSEGEIIDAVRRMPSARTMDAIKRRTRAGMGRCQSGFCTARIMEILRREFGEDFIVTKKGEGSALTENTQAGWQQ